MFSTSIQVRCLVKHCKEKVMEEKGIHLSFSTKCQMGTSCLTTDLSLHSKPSNFYILSPTKKNSGSLACKSFISSETMSCSLQGSRKKEPPSLISQDILKYHRATDLLPVDTKSAKLLAYLLQHYSYYRLCVLGIEQIPKTFPRTMRRPSRSWSHSVSERNFSY